MNKGFTVKQEQINGIEVVALAYGEALSAKIAPKEGNNLFSFVYDGIEVIDYDEDKPLADFQTGTPVLFPFPNRIEDAMWQWQGEKYLQKKNGVPVWLHSLVYDDKSWEYAQPSATEQGALLHTWITVTQSHPIYRGYPFCFVLSIDYLLNENGLDISYEVKNNSDKSMPYGFALHPYFKRIGNTKITVPANKVYERRDDIDPKFLCKVGSGFAMTPNILPTGELADVDNTKYDLNAAREVNSLDLDDVYTQLQGVAMIDYRDEKLKVTMESTDDFAHAVVYTPKGEGYFCIEPQTCATDAINLHARGITHANLLTLEPGCKSDGNVRLRPERYE